MRRRRLASAVPLLLAMLHSAAVIAAPPYAGRRLDEVLHEFSARGLQLIYSSRVVPPGLRVKREPAVGTDLEVLADLLAQHGLRTREISSGVHAIVRAPAPAPGTAAAPAAGEASAVPVGTLEEIVVASSRYALHYDTPDEHTLTTQAQVDALPRFAEDSLKVVHRLPGAASNGLSGLAHIRGGEQNETSIQLDGLPLYEPFHLRLLQSPTSVLDERIVESLDVHAGGFTAEFGDRMSAIIDVRTVHPEPDAYYELGLSLFHAHGLASRRFADDRGQWLVAARRSNLDELADILDSDLGEPGYTDGFARLDYSFSADTRGSLRLLVARDDARVTSSDETESADVEYANSYVWATLEHDWSERLHGLALLSFTDVDSRRTGQVEGPRGRRGSVDDGRDYDVLGLRLDGSYEAERWLHRFGIDVRSLEATYDYSSEVHFEPGDPWPASPGLSQQTRLATEPSGEHVAAYFTTRLRVGDALTTEFGLRWDEQTYAPDADSQLAPRLNLLWTPVAGTRLRASWGRYWQFQGIEELQVEDGIEEFYRAQYADHSIVAVERDLPQGYTVRAEGYVKDYQRLRPRYESLFDPLSLVPELRWDRVRLDPVSARARGVEVLLTKRSEGPWNGWLSYAWAQVEDRLAGESELRSWDQSHSVGAGLTWTDQRWEATAAAMYHTGWPVTPVRLESAAGGATEVSIGPRNADRYAHFATLDLRASREFQLRRGALTVHAELSNALDRNNPCCVDFAVERRADGTLELRRDYSDWLPLVPSLGALWKF